MHASLVFEQVLDINNPIVIVNFMNVFKGFAASRLVVFSGPKKKSETAFEKVL